MRYDDALGALVELAASRHNAFTSAEAAGLHIPAQRLRRAELLGELHRLHPRVWAFTFLPATPKQALHESILSIPGTAATATSAAWLHGWLPKPRRPPQIWLPRRNGTKHCVADLLRWARIDPDIDITTVDHIATLNKAAALCSLGPHVDALTLERCLDDFLRTDSARWLDEAMERLGSRKPGGVRALERIRNHPKRVAGVTDSWMERVTAQLIALRWLPPIVLQHPVEVDGRQPDLFVRLFAATARARATQLGVALRSGDDGPGWIHSLMASS